MDTSGGSTLSIVVDLVVLALFAGVVVRPVWRRALRRPWPALVAVVIIGVPSLAQFAWPQVGAALMRDPDATLHRGEWWRVVTALLAQDGGLAAAVFGLVVVALVMLIGSAVWGWWLAALLFIGCSVVLNLAALGWQPGGGSSFASDGLLMATAARLALGGRQASRGRRPIAWAAAVQLAGGVVLVAAGDAHGVALVLGFALGAALTATSGRTRAFTRRRRP